MMPNGSLPLPAQKMHGKDAIVTPASFFITISRDNPLY
jgi:hypothetical protein